MDVVARVAMVSVNEVQVIVVRDHRVPTSLGVDMHVARVPQMNLACLGPGQAILDAAALHVVNATVVVVVEMVVVGHRRMAAVAVMEVRVGVGRRRADGVRHLRLG